MPKTGATLHDGPENHHVRAHHRSHHRRQLHRCARPALPLILLAGSLLAHAVPPLMPATDVAQLGLVGWWREGELLVGVPQVEGRPGVRPLVSTTPTALPTDLSGWEPVGHTCQAPPRGLASVRGLPMEGVVLGDEKTPVIALIQGDRIMAQNTLGRPALVCEIRIVQADKLPGLELVVAWRTQREAGIQGITVFRIPEALEGFDAKGTTED